MQHLQPNTTLQGGKYRIERVLGQGGFGITYLARNTVFDVNVAIKEFFMKDENGRDGNSVTMPNTTKSELFNGQKEKFKKEAKRMFAIKNEHIIGVHDLFEENGTAYYVMDYIDGESLAARLKRTGNPMTENEVNNILPQILDALKVIHDNGIWHLDLKPANIMIDKAGNIKLIDFGASKQLNAQKGGATTSTAISYTNGYAPREQMEQNYEKFGPWTDIYALGATLYNLLTNKRPPLPSDIDDDTSKDKHLALPMPNVSEKTKHLVLSMMRTNRLQRRQSVNDIYLEASSPAQEPKPAPADKDEETVVVPKSGKTDGSRDAGAPTSKPNPEPKSTPKPSPQPNPAPSSSSKKWIGIGIAALLLVGVLLVWNPLKKPIPDKLSIDSTIVTTQKDRIIGNLIANMVPVEGGTFTMGATSEQGSDTSVSEKPAHRVTLSAFSIGKYEVKLEEWEAVMGSNPSGYGGAKRPVEEVSWNDCQEFIRKLNAMTGRQFRLPTEAEWEYAARGGNKSLGYKYAGSNNIDVVAVYDGNTRKMKKHYVGQKQPNELGVYDMSGNVSEWCQDWYDSNYHSSSPQTNPMGPSSGSLRVHRGGSWYSDAWFCRVSYRKGDFPSLRSSGLGLRLAY